MGGRQVHGTGTGDDGFDEEGYDESQRAEIMEVERDGPSDGVILTDMSPDLGEDEDLLSEDEDGFEVIADQEEVADLDDEEDTDDDDK